MNLYTDIDPFCCRWLEELIKAGELPQAEVWCRDIKEIKPDELRHFHQVHFFAGIGGWPLAIRLAGYDGPCWTASLPCQPFSVAGKRRGESDDRHLWPVFRSLVRECGPPVCFGEQVASKDGREWLARVRADLETMGYAVGCADLCAASVGAPHIRQRLWWVADSNYRSKRDSRYRNEQVRRESVFSRFKDVRGIEDLRNRSSLPKPLFRVGSDGLRGDLAALRGYGNAIVPQVAAEFVTAWMETKETHAPLKVHA